MTVELTQEVVPIGSHRSLRLVDHGREIRPAGTEAGVVFLRRHGSQVYTEPNSAKVRHIRSHPRVSLNLDSDGNGRGTVVVSGEARIDAEGANSLEDEPYQAKYRDYAVSMGMTEEFSPRSARR